VELTRGKKVTGTVEADEGVFPTTADGLAKLRTVLEGGTVTFGTQTYPADGNAGLVVCGEEQAARLSGDGNPTIRLLSFGEARVEPAMMPKAVVPAARDALRRAEIEIGDCAVIKTHNPFAVNDVIFCREFGLEPERVNRFGSPLIWGHPQAPTGLRAVIEMIEELALAGGGYGLFSGCAAGDTAMAVVLKVG
jgi:acetyl-CoA acetyltransferase